MIDPTPGEVRAAALAAEQLAPIASQLIPLTKRQQLKHWLLDAKKAAGVLSVFTGAAVAHGLLPSSDGGLILYGAGLVSTGVVWLLDNLT